MIPVARNFRLYTGTGGDLIDMGQIYQVTLSPELEGIYGEYIVKAAGEPGIKIRGKIVRLNSDSARGPVVSVQVPPQLVGKLLK